MNVKRNYKIYSEHHQHALNLVLKDFKKVLCEGSKIFKAGCIGKINKKKISY